MTPHIPFVFKETPTGPEDEYYALKQSDLDSITIYQPENNTREIRYKIALENILLKLPSSDLEDFLKYQLGMIEDRLDWLRKIDAMINKNRRSWTLEPSENELVLKDLIGQLISQIKKEENSRKDLFESSLMNSKIQLNVSVAHFAGLMRILIEEKIIKEFRNKEEFYRTISGIFLTQEGEELDTKYFKNNYLKDSGKHYEHVRNKLNKAAKRADKKIEKANA